MKARVSDCICRKNLIISLLVAISNRMGDEETFITVPSIESASHVKYKDGAKSAEDLEINTPRPSEAENGYIRRRQTAVRTIEKWWRRVRDRRIFKIFKQAVCAAENSLTRDLIRKLSPSEAALLQDPAVRARVKLRLGGESFPPIILYKIFFSKDVIHVQYMSGKTMIRPSTEAAEDASRQMSNRAMFDQMITDACYHPKRDVQDEIDVVTVKDYMQYRSVVDESPAYIGGKGNSWRTLNASSLPRHSTMHSVAELLAKAAHLAAGSVLVPSHYTLNRERSHTAVLGSPQNQPRPGASAAKSGRTSSRRSWQARERAEMMRRNYVQQSPLIKDLTTQPTPTPANATDDNEASDGSDWESDALMLYQWTKGL